MGPKNNFCLTQIFYFYFFNLFSVCQEVASNPSHCCFDCSQMISRGRNTKKALGSWGWGWGVCSAVPPVCRVELRGDHVQGVPRRDAEAVVQTEHEDHHGLAGAEPKEEAADARQHHGAPCRITHVTTFMSTFTMISMYELTLHGTLRTENF